MENIANNNFIFFIILISLFIIMLFLIRKSGESKKINIEIRDNIYTSKHVNNSFLHGEVTDQNFKKKENLFDTCYIQNRYKMFS